MQNLYSCLSLTQFSVISSEDFLFKMLTQPLCGVKIYKYCVSAISVQKNMTEFKSKFTDQTCLIHIPEIYTALVRLSRKHIVIRQAQLAMGDIYRVRLS